MGDARLGDARLSVLLSVSHPLAYLALHPAIDLGRELEIPINWLPLDAPALRPMAEAAPTDDRGTRHRRYRAEAIRREIATYAEVQGLVIREVDRDPDTRAANLGWLWMRERMRDQLETFLAELFRSYWAVERDVSSVAETAALVEGMGADGAAFSAWAASEGPRDATAVVSELGAAGLFQVPAFVTSGEVFYGRQHLPMIRSLLAQAE
jgi:2-hydroxychromene-2-carboxylate isomerase